MPKPPDPSTEGEYPGFYAPLYTQVPDELFDYWLPRLSEAELKVLLYIMRRTFGFKKTSDNISLSQLVEGIVKQDGTRLDWGTGLAEETVRRGVKGLLRKGLILTRKNQSPQRGHEPTTYALRLRAYPDTPFPQFEGRQGDNLREALPLSESQPLPSQLTPQETVVQETENKREDRPLLALHTFRMDAQRLHLAIDEPRLIRAWLASGLDERTFIERVLWPAGAAGRAAYWASVERIGA